MKFLNPWLSQTFTQWANQLYSSSTWPPISGNLIQPLTAWLTNSLTTVSFFEKIDQDEAFHQFLNWREAFKYQLKQLVFSIKQSHQQGAYMAPNQLRDAFLLTQQTFNPANVSPLYYDGSLKRLAQRLPTYAYVVNNVREQFQTYLADHPQEALAYFYQDVINHSLLCATNKLSAHALLKALTYYQDLVPATLYQPVASLIQAFQRLQNEVQAQEGMFALLPESDCQKLITQINQVFLPATQKATSQNTGSLLPSGKDRFRFFEAAPEAFRQVLQAIKQPPFMAGWDYLKAHPSTVLWSSVTTFLGASTFYLLSQEGTYKPSLSGLKLDGPVANLLSLSGVWPTQFIPGITQLAPAALPVMSHWAFNAQAQWPSHLAIGSVISSILTFIPTTQAQLANDYFVETLTGSGLDWTWAGSCLTANGDIALAGHTTQNGGDIWVSKISGTTGDALWSYSYGGSRDDVPFKIFSMGNQIMVTGYTYSVSSNQNAFILCLDAINGNVVWSKTLLAASAAGAAAITSDDKLVVGGHIVNASGYPDMLLMKIDTDGTLMWMRKLVGNANNSVADVFGVADGSIVVTGYTKSFGASGIEALVAKVDSNGNLIHANRLYRSGDDYGIAVYGTDTYTIVGGTGPNFNLGWIARLDNSNNIQWAKVFGTRGLNRIHDINLASDDDILFVGETESYGNGARDILLSKMNSTTGNAVWSRTLGSSDTESPITVQSQANGNILVAANRQSSNLASYSFLFANLDSTGNIPDCGLLQPVTVSFSAPSITNNAIPSTAFQVLNNALNNWNIASNAFSLAGHTECPVVVTTTGRVTTSTSTTGLATTGQVTTSTSTTGLATTGQITTSASTTGLATHSSDKQPNTTLVVGIAAGAAGLAVGLGVGGVFFFARKRLKKNQVEESSSELELKQNIIVDRKKAYQPF